VQGVVKSYDPGTGQGTLVVDTDMSEYDLAADALSGSIFRMLRQGQRVVFELDGRGLATSLHIGSEVDMATPRYVARSRTASPGYSQVPDGVEASTLDG
jgi:CspA family cold shock protein